MFSDRLFRRGPRPNERFHADRSDAGRVGGDLQGNGIIYANVKLLISDKDNQEEAQERKPLSLSIRKSAVDQIMDYL